MTDKKYTEKWLRDCTEEEMAFVFLYMLKASSLTVGLGLVYFCVPVNMLKASLLTVRLGLVYCV